MLRSLLLLQRPAASVGASLVHNNRLVLGLDHGWSAARTPPLMSTCLAWAGTSGPTHHIHVSATVDALGVWDGSGSQDDLMLKDECILVDSTDRVIGRASKADAHRFRSGLQPEGLLHRAFSVFLFDNEGRLLLQKRAASKITFPNVWTNTCCSHPLHGYQPSELDTDADVAAGTVPGAKRAAIRKLGHELGISPQELPLEGFRYLTRLHYCAPDTSSGEPGSQWGEHEVDYILFMRGPVSLDPNPEEISETRYVTEPELEAMMAPDSGLLWSPWFKIIAENFLSKWWRDLDATLKTEVHVDTKTVHRLYCSPPSVGSATE